MNAKKLSSARAFEEGNPRMELFYGNQPAFIDFKSAWITEFELAKYSQRIRWSTAKDVLAVTFSLLSALVRCVVGGCGVAAIVTFCMLLPIEPKDVASTQAIDFGGQIAYVWLWLSRGFALLLLVVALVEIGFGSFRLPSRVRLQQHMAYWSRRYWEQGAGLQVLARAFEAKEQ